MIKKETWYVLAAFGILLLAAVLLQRQQASQAAAVEPTPRPLVLAVDTALLAELQVAAANGERVRYGLTPEGLWEMLEPPTPADRIDQFSLQSAVGLLRQLYEQAPLAPLADLASVGLETPEYTLTLVYLNGSQQDLYIGGKTFNNGAYYVRLPGQPAQLLNLFTVDILLDLLRTPPVLGESGAP